MAQTKCLLLTGTFILLLAAGWHSCRSQTSSLPASSTRTYGYFNRTSLVTLAASTWNLRYTTKEVTFRTCVPDGTLLAQAAASGSAGSARFFKLYLTNGSMVFQWNTTTGSSSRIFVGSSLADNQQYTVMVKFDLGVIYLMVRLENVATYSAVVANSTFNSDLLSAGITSTDLLVGQNFTGCLFNGEGVNFGLPLVSENVVWNECPLLTRTGCSAVENDGNDCYSLPCQNGGTCVDGYRSYTCNCPINFNGTNCQNDLARLYGCLIRPCLNNATCAVQASSITGGLPYHCNCAPGYTGQNCETELDECQKNPCMHGSCIRHVNGYTCNCTGTGYIGTNCSEDINECNSSPCGSGTCSNFPGSYACFCQPGFAGKGCQDIDECLSLPCQNGGTCTNGVDKFTCQCPVGFNGSQCEHNIDDCIGKTCPTALTTCQDLVASYQCVCLAGYTGMPGSCTEINECLSNPCQNGGTCRNLINGYNCSCVSGFSGTNCQTNVDDCAIRRCENNATCVDGINSYRCVCQPGFTSYNCSTNIDDCLSSNCQNGATCVDLVNGFKCSCGIGWTGVTCERDIDDCASGPCLYGSTCVDHLGSYTCSCVPGYTGTNCQTDINDCSPNPCQNGGNCIDKVNDYNCSCTSAWMGRNCSEEYDACSFHPCQNNATCTCVKKQHNYTCSCVTGFSGQNCEIDIDDCVGKNCGPYQRCFDRVNGYNCACPTGYNGTTCSTDIDECIVNPCQHGGNCTNYIGGYNCTCKSGVLNPYDYRTGWTGVNCETDINECSYNPPICKNGGTCVNLAGSHKCNCNPQTDNGDLITGYNCEVVTSYCTASGLVCENGGTCHSMTGGFWCSCVPGYTGKNCSVNINECASAPCKNNATCLDGINNYTCQCILGFTGSNCEINIDDCVGTPCGHGRCIDEVNGFHCDCYDSGFTGDLCDININDCVNATCLHNSSCWDGIKNYSCECFQGYQGVYCEIDIRECDSNPCQFGGTCLEYSNQTLYSQGHPGFSVFSYATAAGYKCECIPGITGANCETNIDDCRPGVCLNNATCHDLINNYTCVCSPGYRGDHCQTEINECLEYTPCRNGATCHDLIADYFCQCPGFSPSAANYDGKNCSMYLRGCDAIHPCLHGQCVPLLLNETANQHSYRCECDAGFTERNCTESTTMTFAANGSKVWFASNVTDSFSLSLRFRTTLRAAVLLLYGFSADNFVSLEIREGRLIIAYSDNSSIPVTKEVDSQDQVNNADWQQVFLSLDQNISLTLISKTCGTQRCLTQFAYPQGKPSILQTSIFFGYLEPHLRQRTISQQTYVGCMEDIIINNTYFYDGQQQGRYQNMIQGCPRTEQCDPYTCSRHGSCVDLWDNFQCQCDRPYWGRQCEKEYTAATFYKDGYPSMAIFSLPSNVTGSFESGLDISFFVRTRKEKGIIMYLGNLGSDNTLTYITLEVMGGHLEVRLRLCMFGNLFTSSGGFVAGGSLKFVQLKFASSNLTLELNHQVVLNEIVPTSSCSLVGMSLLLGRVVPSSSSATGRKRRQIFTDMPAVSALGPFNGVLQDVQLQGYKLDFYDRNASDGASALKMTDSQNLTIGAASTENICSTSQPCENGGTCHDVFFNDFSCDCPHGFLGKNCSQLDFCKNNSCPTWATCRSLQIGFECISTGSFSGVGSSVQYRQNLTDNLPFQQLSFRLRTQAIYGVIFEAQAKDANYFIKVRVWEGSLEVNYLLKSGRSDVFHLKQHFEVNDGVWSEIEMDISNNSLLLQVSRNGSIVAESEPRALDGAVVDFATLVKNGTLTVGATADMKEQAFKGCLEEVRVGGILLPFVPTSQMVDNSAVQYFVASSTNTIQQGCLLPSPCIANVCRNGGQCFMSIAGYQCQCPAGYSGRYCQNNVNDCVTSACQNGGQCIDGVNAFTCKCRPGFAGTRCQDNVDSCSNSSCSNTSQCVANFNITRGYVCNCSNQSFTGDFCNVTVLQNCTEGLCHNGGTCQVKGSSFSCNCTSGFQGPLCESEVNFCASLPCKNGSNCTSSPSGYSCTCPTGWTGRSCDTMIKTCTNTTCKNGGTCADDDSCNCLAGWTGMTCENEINECQFSPCARGNCSNTFGSYSCNCASTGYGGQNCTVELNECELEFCKNGNCSDTEGNYTCSCQLGYKGQNCSVATCEQDQCQNNSTCNVINNGTSWECHCLHYYAGKQCKYEGPCLTSPCNASNTDSCNQMQDFYRTNSSRQCICKPGWEGDNCSADVNECSSGTICKNNGKCQNTIGSFGCSCVAGYEGLYCEEDINECSSSPCQNDGLCSTPDLNSYVCNCSGTGYTGQNCTEDVNECETGSHSPCYNGGTCSNTPGNFTCLCGNLYLGSFCEHDNPCSGQVCANGGKCSSVWVQGAEGNGSYRYQCNCMEGYAGDTCEQSPQKSGGVEAYVIYAPIIAFVLLALLIGVIVFIMIAKKKRATRGAYSPSQQETAGSRVELGNVLKKPPEERLI